MNAQRIVIAAASALTISACHTQPLRTEVHAQAYATEIRIKERASLWRGRPISSVIEEGLLVSTEPNGTATNFTVVIDGATNLFRCFSGIVETVNHTDRNGDSYSIQFHTDGTILMYGESTATKDKSILIQLYPNGQIESYVSMTGHRMQGLCFFLSNAGQIEFATNYVDPVEITIVK